MQTPTRRGKLELMQTFKTTAQLAAELGITPQGVRKRVESGSLEPIGKLPGRTGAFLFSTSEEDDE